MPTDLYLWIFFLLKQANFIIYLSGLGQLYESIKSVVASAVECADANADASAAQPTTQFDATGQVRPTIL